MVFFTSDRIEKLQKRYGHLSPARRPFLAKVALDEEYLDVRDQVEGGLGAYSLLIATSWSRISNPTQFLHTLHELQVGVLFSDLGFPPHYERPFESESGEITPDWVIGVEADEVLCDVFTAEGTRVRKNQNDELQKLVERLQRLNPPRFLILEYDQDMKLDVASAKDVAREVQEWLRSGGPTRPLQINGFKITDEGQSEVTDVLLYEECSPSEVSNQIRSNFTDKAKKYGSLQRPLIITGVKYSGAELPSGIIDDLLWGGQYYRFGTPGAGGQFHRRPDSVLSHRPELSAAIWMNPYRVNGSGLKIVRNREAAHHSRIALFKHSRTT